MAIALGLGYSCHTNFRLNYSLLRGISNARLSCVATIEDEPDGFPTDSVVYSQRGVDGIRIASEWKRFNSNELGIANLMIAKPTRVVLNRLKRKGFDVYLVGGCVRDLILKRTPKDFDVLTTADLKEVTKAFSWCEMVGKRFPICHVHVGDSIVEVRTIHPASISLVEDCSRILRAIRIAARLRFGFSRELARAIKHLAHSVLLLDKGRHLMEMNYMLAYGSAEASLRLLWRFGLLELLLPIQAAYFVRNGFRRRDKNTNMLLSLFSNLDKLLAPDRPCHSSLWLAILAFHMAFLDCPRDPLVVAVFSLAVHNGGDIDEAIGIAKSISKPHATIYHELSQPENLKNKALKKKVLELGVSISTALSHMTDSYYVSRAMSSYPKAPSSDLVFISLHLYLKAVKIFECVNQGKEARFVAKQGGKIDYDLLAVGSLQEVRHVFARVVFDTVYPLDSCQG